MRTPPAEVDIDAGLIAGLVQQQFPDLAGPVEVVDSGWDNVIARLGDRQCVRLPRRALSAPLVQHEADWLPRLAPQLPVDVPTAVAVGAPSTRYPWTWLICPWFDGRPLTDLPVPDRTVVAEQLGGFAAALHVPAPAEAPVSPWRGIALAQIADRVAERLDQLPAEVRTLMSSGWDRAMQAPPFAGPPVWVHGDLHPLNILVGPDSPPTLRAVIDWGDLCRGDPACDLAVAWLAFGEPGRSAFREAAAARHPPDDPVWDRALGWAIALGSLFVGNEESGSALRGVGDHLVEQLVPPAAGQIARQIGNSSS